MLVPWTVLQPSERAQRWRQVGSAIAAASSVALLAASIWSRPFSAGLALLAASAAVVAWAAGRERATARFEIGVSATGEIELRESDPAASAPVAHEPPLHVAFAAPWLISLRRGAMLIPIWPDSLPHSVFRQLWVHLHWGRAGRRNHDQPSERTRIGAFAHH